MTYVRPVLEYAAPVWHSNLTCKQSASIESIQKRACKIIFGLEYSGYESALNKCGLIPMAERREDLCTKFAQSCVSSDRFKYLFPENVNNHTMLSEIIKQFNESKIRVDRYGNSAIPYLTRRLNMQF
jgi:hypothetical protein